MNFEVNDLEAEYVGVPGLELGRLLNHLCGYFFNFFERRKLLTLS